MNAGQERMGTGGAAGEPSEAELRAAWEEQLRRLTPADVIVQTAVSLISLAGRRLGLDPGTEGERDLGQVRDAIDGARALLPVLERGEPGTTLAPLRDAISALQLEYAKLAGAGAAGGSGPDGPGGGPTPPGGGGPTPPGGGPAPPGGGPAPPGGGDQPRPAPARSPEPPDDGQSQPGPAQRSGRLWVPGS